MYAQGVVAVFCHSLIYHVVVSGVTVEEGSSAILECPGFVPDPEGDENALFYWFKARLSNTSDDNRVAFYAKRDGNVDSLNDLAGRATVHDSTGALEIVETRVSDDHIYACRFLGTAKGDYENETTLTITVTPSENDLNIITSPPDPVPEGSSLTLNCRASRVRPPPQQMYLQFLDDPQHLGQSRNTRNSDGLTSSVYLEHTFKVTPSDDGRKLRCYYVTQRGRTITSREETIRVIWLPKGQPSLEVKTAHVEVHSTVKLTCEINGTVTWYQWLFQNRTAITNTTEKTLDLKVNGTEETINIICVAGNSLGKSNTSKPLSIVVQKLGGPDLTLIIGCVIGGVLAIVFIIVGVVMYVRHRRLSDEKLEPEIQDGVNVNYNQVPEGGEIIYAQPIKKSQRPKKNKASNGEYANGNLGDGKTLSEDGLIYTQPEFIRPTPPTKPEKPEKPEKPGKPPKPAAKPRLIDHTPTEYGEVDFNKMAEMKKK